ncbi:MAG: hypothetical protein WB698_07570 [Solirubrobacteraceae bacterium]
MRFLVTSAGSANGGGHDAVLAFNAEGELVGAFSDDPRIVDPRGLCIDPSGTLIYLNSVDRMLALDHSGRVVHDSGPMTDLDPGGAVFGPDGCFYVTMRRRRTILGISATLDGHAEPSESPFRAPNAVVTVREYDPASGDLVRVFAPDRSVNFRQPRGLRLGPDGHLYCVGEAHAIAFDFSTGDFLGPVVRLPRLHGQALVLLD